jgi:hypothetical protein
VVGAAEEEEEEGKTGLVVVVALAGGLAGSLSLIVYRCLVFKAKAMRRGTLIQKQTTCLLTGLNF